MKAEMWLTKNFTKQGFIFDHGHQLLVVGDKKYQFQELLTKFKVVCKIPKASFPSSSKPC